MLSSPTVEISAEAGLCSCGHVLAAHDEISRRFCAATTAHGLSRGCVCPADTPGGAARS